MPDPRAHRRDLAQRQDRTTDQAITDRLRSLTATTPLGLIHLDDEHIAGFARATRLAPGEVSGMLLAPLGERYGPLNPAFTPRTTPTRMIYDNPWVLTRSSRYCPFCLTGHGDAIQDRHGGAWQRLWRLPVIFLCLRHRRLLSHRCTRCGTLAQFVRTANSIARLSDDSLHPTQCRFTARSASHRQPTGACGADLARPDISPGPDPVTMNVLLHVQRELGHLLAAGGPATTMSAGAPVPVAHYFADLRAIVAMIFRSWPEARPYASTPVLVAALDAEHAARAAQAEPLLNSAGKKKTSKPYTVPPDDSLVTGAVLDIAAQFLGTPDRHEARERLAPLVLRLRAADRALSTYLRRPGWISKQLRSAVEDEWKGASRRSKPSTSSPASSPAEPRTTWPTSTWPWPPGGASRLSATPSTAHAKNSASPPEAPPCLGGAP
ncbi:TniQ family protein [Streptomyces sp. NBC_00878]|uniref:TniQ family protein n=1 Tax=Streptomyces sp. NBC_00878 TaxID=2975854 RepID=UPI00224CFCAB|nr:TniQ family protein [Streptomyces sp. NBC_00878]MCX4906675.1 TniQ family protein [Streptomyces sp. NBC_00878]